MKDGFLDALPFPVLSGPPWPGIRYFCTTRQGGVSAAPYDAFNLGDHVGDDAQAVAQNRRRLAAVLPSAPVWLRQVHGTSVWQADGNENADAPALIEADALMTARPRQVLAILTADCLPVVMGDTQGRVISVAHAGWRGLAAGVLENTFACLRVRLTQTDAHANVTWRAWIGPGISQAHFDVGADVRQAFTDPDPGAAACFMPAGVSGKWHADLPALAARRLRRMGVQQIWQSGVCTCADAARFYSHRRASQQGQTCGRMATVAWKTGDRPAGGY